MSFRQPQAPRPAVVSALEFEQALNALPLQRFHPRDKYTDDYIITDGNNKLVVLADRMPVQRGITIEEHDLNAQFECSPKQWWRLIYNITVNNNDNTLQMRYTRHIIKIEKDNEYIIMWFGNQQLEIWYYLIDCQSLIEIVTKIDREFKRL